MANVMLALGDFRFEVSTAAYQRLQRAAQYRWASQERIGRAPALQFVGPGEATVDLDGVIYPGFRGGLGQVAAMRDLAGRGEPLDLVDGMGNVWGPHVILEVDENQEAFLDNGAPRKVEFSLKLSAYGEDNAGARTGSGANKDWRQAAKDAGLGDLFTNGGA